MPASLFGRIAGGYATIAVASLLLALALPLLGMHGAVTPQGFALRFFQQVVGTLDGHQCPSYPVCSFYARQAVEQHGVLLGSWLMLDRLIHEADDVRRGPWVMVNGEQRLYDPLHRNDFWISGEKR